MSYTSWKNIFPGVLCTIDCVLQGIYMSVEAIPVTPLLRFCSCPDMPTRNRWALVLAMVAIR